MHEEKKIEAQGSLDSIRPTSNAPPIPLPKTEDVYGFECPLSLEAMIDPVTAADGHSYERSAIQDWFDRGNRTSPSTNEPLSNLELRPNHNLRKAMEAYRSKRSEVVVLLERQTVEASNLSEQVRSKNDQLNQLEAQLNQLKTVLSEQNTLALTGAGDVGRKIFVEQTAVQLKQRLKDLQFYLPPTVIESLPEKMTLDELMIALNVLSPTSTAAPHVFPNDAEDESKSEASKAAGLPQRFDINVVIDQFLEQDESLLLLIGDCGAGKSFSIWQTTRRLCEKFQPAMSGLEISQCWLPIYISLNQFNLNNLTDLIDRQLQAYGLSKEAITKLKQVTPAQNVEPRVLLMLDGYDELCRTQSKYREHSDFFYCIGGDTWKKGQLKVLVTCRRNYLRDQSEERMVFGVGQHRRYCRFELLPFTHEQVTSYIEMRSVEEVDGDLLEPAGYFEALADSDSLKKIVTNPFILQLFLDVLPSQLEQNTTITAYDLYEVFFDQWIKREVERLAPAKKEVLGGNTDIELMSDFKRMARYLALSMYAHGSTTVEFAKPPQDNQGYQIWRAVQRQIAKETAQEYQALIAGSSQSEYDIFLGLAKASLIREARTTQLAYLLPLSRSGTSYQFVHKSFYEYLVAASIIDLPKAGSVFETGMLTFFNQFLIQTEPAIIDFITELSKQSQANHLNVYKALCSKLFEIIQRSATEPELSQASSNAATILNACEENLGYQSWAGVQLPQADLSYSVLAYTDLRGANLQGTNLTHCVLYRTNLENTDLRGVRWGEYPRLQMGEEIQAIAHHPTKPWIAITQGNTIVLKDRNADMMIGQPMLGHKNEVCSVAFSPDGKIVVSGSSDNTVRLWDTQTQQSIGRPMVGHTDAVLSVSFSPDGLKVVSGSNDHTIRLWNRQTQQPIGQPIMTREMLREKECVNGVAFSPNGAMVVSCGNDYEATGNVRLWDSQTQQPIGQAMGHVQHGGMGSYVINSVAFSPDGAMLVSGGDDKTVRLWDVQTQQPIGQLMIGHTDCVISVAFSPNGRTVASRSIDGTVRLWSTQTQRPIGQPIIGHTSAAGSMIFDPDGTMLLSSGDNGTVCVWDIQFQKSIKQSIGHTDSVSSVAFSPDGLRVVSTGKYEDYTVRLWDTRTYRAIGQPMIGHYRSLYDNKNYRMHADRVAFHSDGRTLIFNSGSTARLWDSQTQQPIRQEVRWECLKPRYQDSVSDYYRPPYDYSPDGTKLVSGSFDHTVYLWDVQTQKQIGKPMVGHTNVVNSVAFSPDGRIVASGSKDQTVHLWNTQTQQPIGQLINKGKVIHVAFSPDGLCICCKVLINDNLCLCLWNVKTQQLIGELVQPEMEFVRFSPDGRMIVLASHHTLYLWEIAQFKTTKHSEGIILLKWHQRIHSIDFAPRPSQQMANVSLAEEKSERVFSDYNIANFVSENEDMLVIGDSTGAISFWAVSRGSNPQARFLGMPKHPGMPYFLASAQFSGCQMSVMSSRLLKQHGADITGVQVVDEVEHAAGALRLHIQASEEIPPRGISSPCGFSTGSAKPFDNFSYDQTKVSKVGVGEQSTVTVGSAVLTSVSTFFHKENIKEKLGKITPNVGFSWVYEESKRHAYIVIPEEKIDQLRQLRDHFRENSVLGNIADVKMGRNPKYPNQLVFTFNLLEPFSIEKIPVFNNTIEGSGVAVVPVATLAPFS